VFSVKYFSEYKYTTIANWFFLYYRTTLMIW